MASLAISIVNIGASTIHAPCTASADGARTKFACLFATPSRRLFLRHHCCHPGEPRPSARARAGRRFMRRPTLAVALAAALCGLIAVRALAQNAEPAPAATAPAKAKAKPEAPAGCPRHGNSDERAQGRPRRVAGGGERFGKLEESLGALKAGKQASAKLPQDGNCRMGPARDLRRRSVDGCVRRRRLRAKDAQS